MDTATRNPTTLGIRIVGILNIAIFICISAFLPILIDDEPAVRETADFLNTSNLQFASNLTAILVAPFPSMVLSLIIGSIIAGGVGNAREGLFSNFISKLITRIALIEWGIAILATLTIKFIAIFNDIIH